MRSPRLGCKATLVVSLLAAAFFTTDFALAQSTVLEEVIVTAQKREQNLQDVPIAITAFDRDAIENLRIEGLEDIGKMTPGIYVTPGSADPNVVLFNIRGIGVLDPQVGQDGRIAVYQDGVYLGKTQGLAFDMPDLERVEIVKGPQGTLYGRNTVGGAINMISATPDPERLTGEIDAEYGNFGHTKISASLNLPLGDVAAFRISALDMERDGWVENDGPGTDFGGESKTSFRAALGVNLTDDINLTLAADSNEGEKEPLFYQATGAAARPFGAAHLHASDDREDEVTTTIRPEVSELETEGVSLVGTWDIDDTQQLKVTIAQRKADTTRFSALTPTMSAMILNQ